MVRHHPIAGRSYAAAVAVLCIGMLGILALWYWMRATARQHTNACLVDCLTGCQYARSVILPTAWPGVGAAHPIGRTSVACPGGDICTAGCTPTQSLTGTSVCPGGDICTAGCTPTQSLTGTSVRPGVRRRERSDQSASERHVYTSRHPGHENVQLHGGPTVARTPGATDANRGLVRHQPDNRGRKEHRDPAGKRVELQCHHEHRATNHMRPVSGVAGYWQRGKPNRRAQGRLSVRTQSPGNGQGTIGGENRNEFGWEDEENDPLSPFWTLFPGLGAQHARGLPRPETDRHNGLARRFSGADEPNSHHPVQDVHRARPVHLHSGVELLQHHHQQRRGFRTRQHRVRGGRPLEPSCITACRRTRGVVCLFADATHAQHPASVR